MLWEDFGRLGRGWDPLKELRHLQSELDRLYTGMRKTAAPEFPAINVWGGEDDMVVTCELPGVAADHLDVAVVKETLTIKGSRKPGSLKEGETYHRRERGYGDFTRTIQLPYKVDADGVKARFDKGILYLTLPRAPEEKPRKISVKTN